MSNNPVPCTMQWTLGDRMRKSRRYRGLSPEDMAARVGVSRQAINAYELDKRTPKLPTLQKWAEVTEVSFEWLCLDATSTMWYSPFAA